MHHFFPKVISVSAMKDWRIRVCFQDHGVVIVDMKPFVDFGVFRALRDPILFQQVKVSFGTVEWPVGLDLDPEWLLKNGVPENLVAEVGEHYEG